MREPRSNNNVLFLCSYHVVWCPKYRRSVLGGEAAKRLGVIIREVAKERQAVVLELEIKPDHVHLLVDIDPQYGIHRLVKQMKGRSSHHLRREFRYLRSRLPTLWTNSYFVATVGGATLEVVKRYIERQKSV